MSMKKWMLSLATALLVATPTWAESVMQVYKSASCGCCAAWVEEMEAAGLRVEVHNLTNVNGKKQELGLPYQLASCHTAVIDGYIIEGHVPANEIQRLLREAPSISGLSVPGMPHGSPGMETGRVDAYEVVSFDLDNQQLDVWSRHNQ
ncbi:DUF411 domain-containing protein [Marinospirillum perlucidum]|uniref:DUF411 domain-containing protein n=1 Tax=Marinospirillum perlucidum TaxID=1982602 RepID=UPI00319EBCDD